MPNILAFTTPDKSGFLVFGVSNTNYLTFDIPDNSALMLRINIESGLNF